MCVHTHMWGKIQMSSKNYILIFKRLEIKFALIFIHVLKSFLHEFLFWRLVYRKWNCQQFLINVKNHFKYNPSPFVYYDDVQ